MPEHFIAEIEKICVLRAQTARQRSLKILDAAVHIRHNIFLTPIGYAHNLLSLW